MLHNHGVMMGYLRTKRIVWLGGRYGAGKTTLAFRLAYELVKSGFCKYIVSNIPCVWNTPLDDILLDEDGQLNVVVVLDEGGLFLETIQDVKEFLVYLRKMNVILIVPSVAVPTIRLRDFKIERVFNAEVIGIPVWIYRVKTLEDKQSDYIFWYHPSEIYGVFDTMSAPFDDGGISDWFNARAEDLQSFTGHGRKSEKKRAILVRDYGVGEVGRNVGEVMEAAENIERAVSVLTQWKPPKKGGR